MGAVCSTCKAPVLWASMPSGSSMPLDVAPQAPKVALVAFRAATGKGVVLTPEHMPQVPAWRDEENVTFHTSHWFTCPFADRHRGQRRQNPGQGELELVMDDGQPEPRPHARTGSAIYGDDG